MTTRNVGDQIDTRYLVSPNGVLTDATVVLTVTDPAGTVTTPSVTHPSIGVYDASFTVSTAGVWFWYWTASGAVVDVTPPESVLAATPGPITYGSLAELKTYLGITDSTQDGMLLDSMISASRSVEHITGRKFWPDQTATARVFKPDGLEVIGVDDFWTTTGLVVATDTGDDGTYATVLTNNVDYVLEPVNGINEGEPGWPYYRIRTIGDSWPIWNRRPMSVQVTAKWGWSNVPGPVKQATLYLGEETFKMKGSPFGVAASDVHGPIRYRTNQKVLDMLAPYRDSPVMVA